MTRDMTRDRTGAPSSGGARTAAERLGDRHGIAPSAPPAGHEHLVWQALADATRRRIVELLAARPRTTGELVAASELSRFAIMKHLNVLVGAGLVLVERRGRERWNRLEAAPLRRTLSALLEHCPVLPGRAATGGPRVPGPESASRRPALPGAGGAVRRRRGGELNLDED